MRLLLDTHAWLWAQSQPGRLNERCRNLIADADETLLFSAASSWEIGIKFAVKKLDLPEPPALFVPKRLAQMGVTPLPVEHGHALHVAELPLHHRDPFDRLLIAQARLERATLVTADPRFLLYDVDVLWAAAGEPPSEVHEGRRPWRTGRGRKAQARRPPKARSRRPKAAAGAVSTRKAK